MILCLAIILIIGINFFSSILISSITVGRWKDRQPELIYKRAVFIYLVLIGAVIFFLNSVDLPIPASVIALIIHVAYMIVLFIVNPYQMSLHVHTVGLWICQISYLLFLVFINVVNLTHKFNPEN